jgi:type I restriction enzyme M protein
MTIVPDSVVDTLFEPDASERHALVSVLTSIHNSIYANDGLSPEQALEETVKLLFVKHVDEVSESQNFHISTKERDELALQGSSRTFEVRIKKISEEVFTRHKDLFEKSERLRIKVTSLGHAVEQLSKIKFSELPHDVKGAAFQLFLSASQRVGRGQFFTPEPIVNFCVAALDPRPTEIVVDPACGSGGFLATALVSSIVDHGAGCIPIGFEISRTAARLAKMRMLLLGATGAEIHQTDALLDVIDLSGLLGLKTSSVLSDHSSGFADVVLTNPPFGTQGKINDRSILERFDLGHRCEITTSGVARTDALSQQVPEVLFIEQCIRLLKPGGRLGIVLPNGEFENPSHQYVRDYLLKFVAVDAIIKLPQETFVPSGTGIKTSLLFGTKFNEPALGRRSAIFFGEVTRLGYSGNKLGTATYIRDGNGQVVLDEALRPRLDEDFSEVLKALKTRDITLLYPKMEKCYESSRIQVDSVRFDYEFHHPKYHDLIERLQTNGAEPLSALVQMSRGKANVLANANALVNYVELSDIGLDYQEIVNCESMKVFELPSRATFEILAGQILFAVAGNSIGTRRHVSALVTPIFDGSICSNGFRVFNVNRELVDPYFLLFALASDEVRQQVFRLRTGAAIPSISDVDLMSVLVPRLSAAEESQVSHVVRSGFESRIGFRREVSAFRSRAV